MGVSSKVMEVREVSAMYDLQAAKPGVPVGYKQTEVGVIPTDWDTTALGSLTVLMTNGFVGAATKHYVRDENGILYIQGYNVEENSFNFRGIKYVSEDFHKSHLKSCLRGGDLLTVQTGDVGLTATVPESLAGSNCHALIISRFNQKRVHSAFISYYLNSKPGRSRLKLIEIGTTMKHLNVGDMLQFLVPLPPTREEQQAIATALSDMDTLLDGLDQLIAKKRDLKQATMQQLLIGQTRLPGFEGEWEVKTIGEVIERLDAGVSVNSSTEFPSDGKPCVLKTSALVNGRLDTTEVKTIVDKDISRATMNPKKDTILISRMNTPSLVGEIAYVDRDFDWLYLPDRIWIARFKGDSKVCVRWLAYMLCSPFYRSSLREIATGTSGSMKNISKPALLAMSMPFPPAKEQDSIAQAISDFDAEIEALEQRRQKTHDLKQAMMQELLTGRTRLV